VPALVLALLVQVGAPSAAQDAPVDLRVVGPPGAAIEPGLVGFNWRAGGAAVKPLRPRLVRSFGVRLAHISPSPDVLDFVAADAELDAVEATGATPLVVLIERPPWDAGAGSAGYERVVEAVLRHFLIDRPRAGHAPVWFESGNEPEFPPTSHGQLPFELAADVAAQVRALVRVETAARLHATYGGPGALFADPAIAAAFVAAARNAGRLPDFISWHAYSNAPLLGPDGPEDRSSPAALAAWELLHGTNPAASPVVLGVGIDVIRAAVASAVLPGEDPPALLITEWNLSSGGLDKRNDTYVGAAHTVAVLIEMHTRRLNGATYFAAVDRHCSDPAANPGGTVFCGDWGTASATGQRKPAWYAFALWQALKGQVLQVDGTDPVGGLWAIATHDPADDTTRVLAASFSVAQPKERRLRIDVGAADVDREVRLRRVDALHPDGAATTAEPLGRGVAAVSVVLPANSVALVEVAAAPRRDGGVVRASGQPLLPATGDRGSSGVLAALAVATAILLDAVRRRAQDRATR
jgi:hypothetical protein